VADKIEFTKSDFAGFMADLMECGPFLPGENIPRNWIIPDDGCVLWVGTVTSFRLAEVAIDRALTQQRVGDALDGSRSEAMLASNRSGIVQFVDDICGTPPKWPLPWPPPNRRMAMDPEGLPAAYLLAAGARFRAAADLLEAHPLQAEFSAAADRLFETGLSRLTQD
jgi:hypothetical protein